MTAVGVEVLTSALVASYSLEVIGVLSHFEGVLLGERTVL